MSPSNLYVDALPPNVLLKDGLGEVIRVMGGHERGALDEWE